MSAESETSVPAGWEQPSPELLASARAQALKALRTEGLQPVQQRFASYYDIDSNYAGASFAQLEPFNSMDITVSDLLATTLLSVQIGPRATRRILQDGPIRDNLQRRLADIPDTDLARAGVPALVAMAELYELVKKSLSADTAVNSNAWVTASKLCARKRPALFPVRDRLVCELLGLSAFKNYQVDWQVFRHLMRDQQIVAAIDAMLVAVEATHTDRLVLDQPHLRLLDAAIWTYAKWDSS